MEKILVVDDQPEIRRLLAVTLRRSFDVQFATDGAAALQSIRESRPRAVLLDIMMPGEPDGLGVLAAIKSDPDSRGIPVGMLTAIIPSFLISVGVGSSIFLLAEIYRRYATGGDVRNAIVEGFTHSAGASALSVVTTAGALLSFLKDHPTEYVICIRLFG